MGFGLIPILIVLIPATILLAYGWLVGKTKAFGIALGVIWGGIFALILTGIIIQKVSAKKILDKENYYGEYIVDRDRWQGKNADWQYNSFRFEIKENDSIYFYQTNKQEIIKTYKGVIKTSQVYTSKTLVINMELPTHHILTTNPTTYRGAWDFYLVFYSPKFENVFFKKGNWTPIDN